MQRSTRLTLVLSLGAAAVLAACAMGAPDKGNPMSFFITSSNPGKGADFGGLAGADQFCQSLASAAGAGGRTWHAYLSAAPAAGALAVHARDRIGQGPWRNAKGTLVAMSVGDLHSTSNKLNKQNSLTEKGEVVSGRGDAVNTHDILTGSNADGTLATGAADTTCRNWTSSTEGSAIVGHHDLNGTNPDPVKNVSWNSSHGTPGCSADALKRVGGAGLLYCFAIN